MKTSGDNLLVVLRLAERILGLPVTGLIITTPVYCNTAIYCEHLACNMQYANMPYCDSPSWYTFTVGQNIDQLGLTVEFTGTPHCIDCQLHTHFTLGHDYSTSTPSLVTGPSARLHLRLWSPPQIVSTV